MVTARQEAAFNAGAEWPAGQRDPDGFDVVALYEAFPFEAFPTRSEGDGSWASAKKLDAEGIHQMVDECPRLFFFLYGILAEIHPFFREF